MFIFSLEGATIRLNSYYGSGLGPIYGYSCQGFENSLSSCSILSYSSLLTCYHYRDVGVECEGEVIY